MVNRQSMTLKIQIQKLQNICEKTSVLESKLDQNSQSYSKMKKVCGLLGHPLICVHENLTKKNACTHM